MPEDTLNTGCFCRKSMKSRVRKYTFRLYPGDNFHAFCIDRLDKLLAAIKSGDLKKGTLSTEIAKALYEYFCKNSIAQNIPPKTNDKHAALPLILGFSHKGHTDSGKDLSMARNESNDDYNDAEDIKKALAELSEAMLQ